MLRSASAPNAVAAPTGHRLPRSYLRAAVRSEVCEGASRYSLTAGIRAATFVQRHERALCVAPEFRLRVAQTRDDVGAPAQASRRRQANNRNEEFNHIELPMHRGFSYFVAVDHCDVAEPGRFPGPNPGPPTLSDLSFRKGKHKACCILAAAGDLCIPVPPVCDGERQTRVHTGDAGQV